MGLSNFQRATSQIGHGVLCGSIFLFLSCSENIDFTPFGSQAFQSLPLGLHEKSVARIAQQVQNCSRFEVGVIGDVHDDYTGFKKAIERVNRASPAFVVVVGDIASRGLIAEYQLFMEFAQKIESPWFVALGNHDSLGRGPEIFRRTFGQENFWFEYCGYRFVFWNNNVLEFGSRVPDLAFLGAAMGHGKIVSVVHIPPDDTGFRDPQDLPIGHLAQKQIALNVSGHEHGLGSRFSNGVRIVVAERAYFGRFVRLIFTPTSVGTQVCHESCSSF